MQEQCVGRTQAGMLFSLVDSSEVCLTGERRGLCPPGPTCSILPQQCWKTSHQRHLRMLLRFSPTFSKVLCDNHLEKARHGLLDLGIQFALQNVDCVG